MSIKILKPLVILALIALPLSACVSDGSRVGGMVQQHGGGQPEPYDW